MTVEGLITRLEEFADQGYGTAEVRIYNAELNDMTTLTGFVTSPGVVELWSDEMEG